MADLQGYSHLRHLPIEEYENAVPRILIGVDNWQVGLPLQFRDGLPCQPIATKTELGWAIQGPCTLRQNSQLDEPVTKLSFHMCKCQMLDEEFKDQVRQFINLDNMGILVPALPLESNEEQRARQILETETAYDGGRFTASLLWRYDIVRLPDSLPMAQRRLEGLERRMRLDPVLAQNLCKEIRKYEEKGYIQRLSAEELRQVYRKTWYMHENQTNLG